MKQLKWIGIMLLCILTAGPALATDEARQAYDKMVEEATQEADEYVQEKQEKNDEQRVTPHCLAAYAGGKFNCDAMGQGCAETQRSAFVP